MSFKDAAFQLVMRVLRSFQNSNEIDSGVKQLNADGVDVLMKYVYKGFEREPKDSNILLNWHDKVFFEILIQWFNNILD